HGGDRLLELGRVAAGAALRLGGVGDVLIARGMSLSGWCLLPLLPGVVGQYTERQHRLDLVAGKDGIQPAVAVRDDRRVVLMLLATGLAVDRVQERIDQ